jgi:penicillin amidase
MSHDSTSPASSGGSVGSGDRRRPRGPLLRVSRVILWLAIPLVAAVAAGGGWFYLQMRASLPLLDGERAIAGLSGRVEVTRDDLGVPTIAAASQDDVVRALGFLHAQDRFFQMDLLRRQAAGELAELFGPQVVPADKEHRLHRLRDVARRVVAGASAADRARLEAYAAGVNAGLTDLGAKPFEYYALRAEPAPWRPEDSVLVVLAMFFDLQGGTGRGERGLAQLHARLPPEVFAFLTPPGTEWDAPLIGAAFGPGAIPGPEVFDVRTARGPAGTALLHGATSGFTTRALGVPPCAGCEPVSGDPAVPAGSNNWAVAGSHTADGKALLANDMHLGLSVPNTWYRVRLEWRDGDEARHITGVSLPGGPAVVVGSNGHVAWGFTNSMGDWIDLVVIEPDPADASRYLVPGGSAAYEKVREIINVKGASPEPLEVQLTRWGPVVESDTQGRRLAIAWTAHHPEALSFEGLFALQRVRNLDEAVAAAHRAGVPAQNFVAADSTGRIGWTIIGQIPRRVGFDGRFPVSWADGTRRWDGWLTPAEVPTVIDPPSGRVWTANNRSVDGEYLARLGDGGFALGARGRQIRDGLMAIEKATPLDLLRVQLDDRALFLERWRTLLLATLSPDAVAGHAKRQEMKRLVETTWTGHAAPSSAAYRLVRGFRSFVSERVWTSVTGQQGVPAEKAIAPTTQFEGPLWALVSARPAHFLAADMASWDALLLRAADDLIEQLGGLGPDLAQRTWGERNTVLIRHPLSRAVPALGRFLDVPPRQLPGDANMPRFQAPGGGASERLVVSPGQEEKGIFHMPVGQSGHPLSPYYRKGHEAWEQGQPTPFLPGPAVHRLALVPAREGG